MGWEDRPQYHDDHRPVGDAFAPPVGPSVYLFKAFGVRVRAHYSLPLFLFLSFALDWRQGYTLSSKIVSLAALVAMLLYHEFGHCLPVRSLGGEMDEVILWPLGGLGTWDLPGRRGPALVAALGGPLANLAACTTWAGLVL